MKERIPWWIKIPAKIVLSRLPIKYDTWQKVGLFRHGYMDSVDYVINIFNDHIRRAGIADNINDCVILEIGPGDSLATALVASCHGARTILLDTGPYARSDIKIYQDFASELPKYGLMPPALDSAKTINDVLEACKAVYLTEGLESFKSIDTGSVDFIFSQAVLEHIRRAEFREMMNECYRIMSENGIASHRIDLKDHLGGSLNNLRFSQTTWESDFFAKSGFYTNRIRYSEMLDIFISAGFQAEICNIRKWDKLPLKRNALAKPFSRLDDKELLISGFDVLLYKK